MAEKGLSPEEEHRSEVIELKCKRLPSLAVNHIRYNWETMPRGVPLPLRFHIVAVSAEYAGKLLDDAMNSMRIRSINPIRLMWAPLVQYEDVQLRFGSFDAEIDPHIFEQKLSQNLRKGPYGVVYVKQDARLLREVNKRKYYESSEPTSEILQKRVAEYYNLGHWRNINLFMDQTSA